MRKKNLDYELDYDKEPSDIIEIEGEEEYYLIIIILVRMMRIKIKNKM